MPEVLVAPGDIHEIAQAFRLASKDSQKIVVNLEQAMAGLQTKWQGVAQQMFYREYTEWHDHVLGFEAVLSNIAIELDAIADRFATADK